MRTLTLTFALLAACGSEPPPVAPVVPATGPAMQPPAAEAAPPTPAEGGANAPAGPPLGGGDGSAEATPPASPPPDGMPADPGIQMAPTKLEIAPGEGVTLSGTIQYSGTLTRPIRIDVSQPAPTADNPGASKIVLATQVSAAGPWSVELPKGAGKVDIVAFIDPDNNGPSDNEPVARKTGVQIGDAPLAGLDLTLTDPPGFVAPPALEPDAMGGQTGTSPKVKPGG